MSRSRSSTARSRSCISNSISISTSMLIPLLALILLVSNANCARAFGKHVSGSELRGDAEATRGVSGLEPLPTDDALLLPHRGTCVLYRPSSKEYWHYELCIMRSLTQFARQQPHKERISLGRYASAGIGQEAEGASNAAADTLVHSFQGGDPCTVPGSGAARPRASTVYFRCCALYAEPTIISVVEPQPCVYELLVCFQGLCTGKERGGADKHKVLHEWNERHGGAQQQQNQQLHHQETPNPPKGKPPHRDDFQSPQPISPVAISEAERSALLEETKAMFYHAYDNYMEHAFPHDQLCPLSCTGDDFEPTAGNMLTLIDSLDTLAIMGNTTEFARGVALVLEHASFDHDITVNVFETTIRVLGGLLSAHLLAIDPALGLAPPGYDGGLLRLATDLADRLMPAFNTATSIPYGTVHLQSGVPKGETTEACTAAAGSLYLEFGVLSALTGNPQYARAARASLKALHDLRSRHNLVGRHVDVKTGRWTEASAGIGSNIDSLYEYFAKAYVLFADDDMWSMFLTLYDGVLEHLRHDLTWYVEAEMHTARVHRRQFSSLQAFWPGLQTMVGDILPAGKTLNSFMEVWNDFGGVPEDFDFVRWAPLRGGTHPSYPLRPELVESVYYMHLATRHDSWLLAGRDIVDALQSHSRVECGYAAVGDVSTHRKTDVMPSYFTGELCKYLYLLFAGDGHWINAGNWVLTTEAHPFRVTSELQQAALRYFVSDSPKSARRALDDDSRAEQCPRDASADNVAPVLDAFSPMLEADMVYYGALGPEYKPSALRATQRQAQRNAAAQRAAASRAALPPGTASAEAESQSQGREAPIPGVVRLSNSLTGDQFDATPFAGGFSVVRLGADGKPTSETIELLHLDTSIVTVAFMPAQGSGTLMARRRDSRHPQPQHRGPATIALDNEEAQLVFLEKGMDRGLSCEGEAWVDVTEGGDTEMCGARVLFGCAVSYFGPTLAQLKAAQRREEGAPDNSADARALRDVPVAVANPSHGCSDTSFRNVRGKVVLVFRGQCMFEEKASHAYEAGAVGILVIQNEDAGVFVMSGKHGEVHDDEAVVPSVPAFMISRAAGRFLMKLLADEADGDESNLRVTLRLEDVPLVWATTGDSLFELRTILRSGGWGARITQAEGAWHLSLLHLTGTSVP